MGGTSNWLSHNNAGPIAGGVAPGRRIFLADMTGDGMADYVVLNEVTGGISIWANRGGDASASHGWRWDPYGEIASGFGATSETLMLADINGDGR